MTTPAPPPLYVGYLPLPSRHRRLLRGLLPALAALMLGFAGVVAALQRDPGDGRWDAKTERFIGTLIIRPYPLLLPDDAALPPLLLVSKEKFGAASLVHLAGSRVELRGRRLNRAGAHMLELDEAHPPAPVAGPTRSFQTGPATHAVLDGEIVDSKCYLGAMKPGEGKAHRACATLCIRGGIPPILVSANPDGTPAYTLLTDHDGSPANQLVLPYIAEPVRVTGAVSGGPGWSVMMIDSIRRTD